jgi:hypothetical protein
LDGSARQSSLLGKEDLLLVLEDFDVLLRINSYWLSYVGSVRGESHYYP